MLLPFPVKPRVEKHTVRRASASRTQTQACRDSRPRPIGSWPALPSEGKRGGRAMRHEKRSAMPRRPDFYNLRLQRRRGRGRSLDPSCCSLSPGCAPRRRLCRQHQMHLRPTRLSLIISSLSKDLGESSDGWKRKRQRQTGIPHPSGCGGPRSGRQHVALPCSARAGYRQRRALL